MNVLLDTCALVPLSNGPLPAAAAQAFGAAAHAYVSTACVWEAAIKFKTGKLHLPRPPQAWFEELCRRYHLTELPLPARLLCAAADLPLIHRDPFDRVLIATAQRDQLILLTSDSTIPTYPGVTTLW
ncbi:MAG: type II toxin-antitoxin system VapC family toxin [Roseimicrobium sp.]